MTYEQIFNLGVQAGIKMMENKIERQCERGKPKPCTCKISPTKVWLFMTSHGYYRKIEIILMEEVPGVIKVDASMDVPSDIMNAYLERKEKELKEKEASSSVAK